VSDADTDNDGTADCNDGCPNDPLKTAPGACGCGLSDADTDNDGTADCNDGCPSDPLKTAPGACGCGAADTDTDGDGTPDCLDSGGLDRNFGGAHSPELAVDGLDNSHVVDIVIQPDGKTLLVGTFFGGIARFNQDDRRDPSFNVGSGASNSVYAVACQPDGKVLIGGLFTSYNNAPLGRIARLHPNGSLDTSFNVGSGANDWVNDIVLQPDGKLIVVGVFT
jgi:hypothetical protein